MTPMQKTIYEVLKSFSSLKFDVHGNSSPILTIKGEEDFKTISARIASQLDYEHDYSYE